MEYGYGILLDHKTCRHNILINTKDSTETVVFVSLYTISLKNFMALLSQNRKRPKRVSRLPGVCIYYGEYGEIVKKNLSIAAGVNT